MSVNSYLCPGSEEGLKTIFLKKGKKSKMAVTSYKTLAFFTVRGKNNLGV